MCILCVIQRWSRRVATMLPWLLISLIGLWAFSQLLPPAYRFEITSPRLGCVFVLLVTLFWYEILMPRLSAWRVRRNARMRERKRLDAIEFDKLQKTATRHCRNCLTQYRDQKPSAGRFMCSYCGHISKRPVLDLPEIPGIRVSNSEVMKGLVTKGEKVSTLRSWSENNWICGQDWLDSRSWLNGDFMVNYTNWQSDPGVFFNGHNQCSTQTSYSGVVIFVCRLLTSFFFSISCLCKKIFSASTSGSDVLSNEGRRAVSAKKDKFGSNFLESREEKARRKAEEKRQSRLEKELFEEEERNQKAEVARLVEERRKLRGERTGADKDCGKRSAPIKKNDSKKYVEKKHLERKKVRDKGSEKSNDDGIEKRDGREIGKKHEFDKKSEIERREYHKNKIVNANDHNLELTNGLNDAHIIRGTTGTRDLHHIGDSFVLRKEYSDGVFYGTGSSSAVTISKEIKSIGFEDHVQSFTSRRDSLQSSGNFIMNGDDKSISQPVAPRKPWQQLFSHKPVPVQAPPPCNSNVISRPNVRCPSTQSAALSQLFDNRVNFWSPFTNGNAEASEAAEEPDPVSLLGPVSESLDNFQLDLDAKLQPSPIQRQCNGKRWGADPSSRFSCCTDSYYGSGRRRDGEHGAGGGRHHVVWSHGGCFHPPPIRPNHRLFLTPTTPPFYPPNRSNV